MSTSLCTRVPSLGRRLFALSVGFSVLTSSWLMAQVTNQSSEKVSRMVITGSLIPTAETVGPAPVETIGTAEIEKVGATDVLDLVKRLSPSFSGNGSIGQEVNNGGFGESYIQIRNLPTLVLLNGRRLGNSSFSSTSTGNGQIDLNTIPLAMIERVEILKDGSSALYGSQAIGGVINIITKKDFNGVEIGGRFGFATGPGSYWEYDASVVGGTSSEKSSFVAGASYYFNDPLLTSDRKVASLGNDERSALNLAPASYISPSFPGKVQSGPNNAQTFLVAGSPFLIGQPGYNPALSTPPVVPGSTFSGPTAVADYNTAAIANGYVDPTGNGFGPYVPFSGAPLLNTTLFGTATIQSQDRRQAFASGEHDLFGKRVQIFGEFLFANTESVGALAPAPVISLFDSRIFVPSNNAFNPFGIDLGPVGGASSPRVRSRFVQSGNRIFDSQTDFYHIVGGLKGDFENGYTWSGSYNYNRSDQVQFTRNAINGAALDLALQPNPDPVLAAQGLSKLQSSSGDFVPMYNMFFTPTDPFPTRTGPNDPATVNALTTTLFQTGRSEEWDADAVINGEPFELPAGKLAFAVGGGYRSEHLEIDFDGLTRIGKVPGLNASDPTDGTRNSYSIFTEVRIPLTSPKQDIPGLRSLELTLAGRYENITAVGQESTDAAVPKFSLRWQPLDEQITVRASYSQSFLAPDVFRLFGGAAVNNPFIFTSADGAFAQEQTVNLSNPALEPVDADNYGVGIVLSPKFIPGLTVSADYYHVKTKNDIFRLSEQAMVNDLQVNGSASPFAPLYRFDDGSQLTTPAPDQITSGTWGTLNVPLANGSRVETDGIDVSANYRLPLDEAVYGRIEVYAAANVVFKFDYQDPLIGGPYSYKGQYTDSANGIGGAQGLIPDFRINTGFTWQFRNFTYSVNARYVPEVDDLGTLHPSNLNFENNVDDGLNDFTLDGSTWKVDSWFAIDMQLAYEFKTPGKWYSRTRIAVGCNNITDQTPPIIASSFEDNTDKATYDIIGRFIYFQLSKKF